MNFIRSFFKKKKKAKHQAEDKTSCLKSAKEVYKNSKIFKDDDVTVHDFIQGDLENCGMVASMATLATNLELYNNVVLQQHNSCYPTQPEKTEFVFNLFENGKPCRVVVDDCLRFSNLNELCYSRSWNENLAGPLLEKALVKLHFDGKYEMAQGVDSVFVLTSLTNNLYERFVVGYDDIYTIHDVITHGLKNNCLMVTYIKENCSKHDLKPDHTYTLVDMTKDFVKLYDPYGKTILAPKQIFFDNFQVFDICYFENKVFNMPQMINWMEFTEPWKVVHNDFGATCLICFDLLVEEDDTEFLLNFPAKLRIHMHIILKNLDENQLLCDSEVIFNMQGFSNFSNRFNIGRGTYQLTFGIFADENTETFQDISENLENEGDLILIRLVSSKGCTMNVIE